MAELRYVDWDGLVYYDGKIKQYISDKLEDCVKMGGEVTISELPSPSFQNLNYIYKITEKFTSDENFAIPGLVYKANTWVQVTDLDGVYLYTIFNEEDISPSNPIDPGTVDLTNYYTKDEVDGIVGELPTKEEFDVVQHQSAVHDVKLMQLDSDLVDINQRIDEIVVPDLAGYATESFVNETIASDLEAYYTKDQVDTLIPDVTNFASKDEVATVEAKVDAIVIPEVPAKVSELENDAGYITANDVPETDLSNYYIKSETENLIAEAVKDLDGYATEDWVNEQGFLKEHQDLSEYAKKSDIPEAELFVVDFSAPDFAAAIEAYNNGKLLLLVNAAPDANGYAVMNYVRGDIITFTKFLTSRSETYGSFNTYYLHSDNTWEVSNEVRLNKVEANVDDEVSGDLTTIRIGKEVYRIPTGSPDIKLDDYYTKEEVNALIPEVPTKVSELENDSNYITLNDVPETDLTNYYTKSEVENLIPNVSAFVTMEDVEGQGYLKEHQSLDGYAKLTDIPDVSNFASKEDIPSIDGLATEQWVTDKGYLTEHQDISGKAEASDLNALAERVTTLSNTVDEKANTSHTHSISEITDYEPTDLTDYAKKSDIPSVEGFITLEDVENQNYLKEVPSTYITDSELDAMNFATKSELDEKATIGHRHSLIDIEDYSPVDLTNYATKDYVVDKINDAALSGDADVDLSAYYTRTEVNDLLDDKSDIEHSHNINDIVGYVAPDLTPYAKTADLASFITMDEVEAKGYLTTIPGEYITESELNEKGFITNVDDKADKEHSHSYNDLTDVPSIPSIDGLATTTYVDTAIAGVVETIPDVSGFITEIPDEYITDDELAAKGYLVEQDLGDYAKVSDLENLATKDEIPTDYLVESDLEGYSKFSGSYNDLTDKPIIPSIEGLATTSDVENAVKGLASESWVTGLGYATTDDLNNYATKAEIPDTDKFITMEDVEAENYLKSIPEEYITEDDLNAKNYITNVDDKADVEHTHTIGDITDYQAPDLSNLATKDDIAAFATEQYVTDKISEIQIPDVSGFLTEIPSEYVTSTELEAEGFLKEHQDLSEYAKKSDLPNVDSFITMSDVDSRGFLTEVPSEYITDDELSAKGYITDISDKADAEHTHSYNELTDKPSIPSIDGLATEQYVDDAIRNIDVPTGDVANTVLFSDDYRVGTPLGLFAQDETVQGLTIAEIVTKLLGLTLYVAPDVPEGAPEYVVDIIDNEIHAYVLDGNGTSTFVEAETDTFYKRMTPEESTAQSTENFFYQIVDPETNELLESGYQIRTVEDSEEWMTIAIPSTITNFHVEQFNVSKMDWTRVTGFVLVPNDDQPIDGYTVYSADGFDGGPTIRIVIE